MIAQIDALGNKTAYTYDANGNVTAVTDPMGNTTSYINDAVGNVLAVIDPLGQVTRYTYDKRSRLTKITLADGSNTEFVYDKANNVIKTIDPMGNTISYRYNNLNQCIEIRDSYATIIEKATYDLMGRTVTVADALGNLTYTAYDSEGQITGMTQTSGEKEQNAVYAYDMLGRITRTIDSKDQPVGITYDMVGNITGITDPGGGVTGYLYDEMDNLVQEENAVGAVYRYTYNARQLLEESEDANGAHTTYEYDAIGRIITKSDDAGTIHYTYDKNSNLLKVEENGATIVRTYDALNRVTSYTDYAGRTIRYDYDEVGNLIALTYPGGEIVRYKYNPDGSLQSVVDSEGRKTQYSYNKNNQLISIRRPDGSTETRSYDKAGRLVTQNDITAAGEVLQNAGYTYDGFGNVIAKSGFDTQLVNTLPEKTKMEYDAANRLIRYNGKKVRYDQNGNMIYGPLNGTMTTFVYDCRNRLTQAGDTFYTYDAEDNRIAVKENGITTEYVINEVCTYSQVLETYQEGSITSTNIYGNDSLLYEQTDADTLYHHYDSIGSTTVLTGQDGSITDTYSYDVYGTLLTGDSSHTAYLYNGSYGVQTDSNGLYYMRARYYNTDISRFINQDILRGTPEDSQSLNRYAYCQGNPVNRMDPFGLCQEKESKYAVAHFWLGIAAMIPYVGIVANVVNAALYFAEGEALDGILCLAFAATGAGSALSALKSTSCIINTAAVALKTAGTAYTATTMARDAIVGAVDTYLLLEKNNFKLNGEVIASAAQTIMNGMGAVSGFLAVGSYINEMSQLESLGMACFTAGTQVLTRDGYKNIEEIEAGDYVYSTDDKTGESEYKEVLQVYIKETDVVTHVYYVVNEEEQKEGKKEESQESGRSTAEVREIETTLNHLFWCEGEWRAAGTLEEGNQLTLADGREATVTDITFEDRHTTVYNMEVADYHTYYVGEDSVWVHNMGCGTGRVSEISESGSKGEQSFDIKFMNGDEGEAEIARMFGGESQVYRKTSLGGRYIDQYSNGIAHESKVGYTTLSRRIKKQILKDAELINTDRIKGAHWHFFKSGVTGKGGASKPLLKFLEENGIKYTIY